MDNELRKVFDDLGPILVDVFVSSLEHSYDDNYPMAERHAKGFNALYALYRYHECSLPVPFLNRPLQEVIEETKRAIMKRNDDDSQWDSDEADETWVVE
jgi:hypothetical protein